MKIKLKTNGYTAQNLQPLKEVFEIAVEKLFPECTLNHFYYGDHIDMVTISLKPGTYAHFSITSKHVGLTGYTCEKEDLSKFESLTYKDPLYKSKLFELAEVKEFDNPT